MSVDDLYREIILDHYRSPRNKRRGVEGAIAVKHDNPLCGDELHLAVDIQGGSLSDVAFDGKGCSISQASASMMTEAVDGKSVKDALELTETIRLMMHGEHPGRRSRRPYGFRRCGEVSRPCEMRTTSVDGTEGRAYKRRWQERWLRPQRSTKKRSGRR